MKTMCLGYHHNGFVAAHALGHTVFIIVCILLPSWCFVNFEHSVCRGSLMTTYIYTHTRNVSYVHFHGV